MCRLTWQRTCVLQTKSKCMEYTCIRCALYILYSIAASARHIAITIDTSQLLYFSGSDELDPVCVEFHSFLLELNKKLKKFQFVANILKAVGIGRICVSKKGG